MLIDVLLMCAPVVAALPAVFALLTSHVRLSSKSRVQKRLYGTLLLAEKLPPAALGTQQIARDIEADTLHVAYLAQYPQRAREIVHLGLIGVGVGVSVGAYYLLWQGDAALLALLIALAVIAVVALWFERALLNFGRNDGTALALFVHFGAPDGLVRPRTELVTKVPALSADSVFERASDVRDADHDSTMTTLAAVNAVLATAHSHFDWRQEARRLGRRAAATDYRALAATAYDWLLRHLLGPFFNLRLNYLDAAERRRAAMAHRSGDVFKAAWLAMHYRNERRRMAEHWAYLHEVRDRVPVDA
jgi:hypothetical protein